MFVQEKNKPTCGYWSQHCIFNVEHKQEAANTNSLKVFWLHSKEKNWTLKSPDCKVDELHSTANYILAFIIFLFAMTPIKLHQEKQTQQIIERRLYSKSNLSWTRKKSKLRYAKNLSCLHLSFLHLKPSFRNLSLSFVRLSWSRTKDKLAINWQNFA